MFPADEVRLSIPLLDRQKGGFAAFPDEVLQNILLFLPTKDIVKSSRVAQDFKRVVGHQDVWAELLKRDWGVVEGQEAMRQPKEGYMKLVGKIKEAEHLEELKRLEEEEQERINRQSERVRVVYKVWHRLVMSIVPAILLLLFVILLARRLDNLDSTSYVEVFSPLIALFSLLLFTIICYTCMRLQGGEGIFRSAHHDDVGLVPFTHQRILRRKVFSRFVAISIVACILAGLVCLSLKLSGSNMSWAVTFIPVWLLAVLFCFAPCALDEAAVGVLSYAAIPPLWLVAMLVTLKFDNGRHIPIEQLLIPLWIMDGIGVSLCLIFGLYGLYRREYEIVFVASVVLLLFLSPWVIFELLLALRVNQIYVTSYLVMFTPLFIWFSFVCCLFTFFAHLCWEH
eukprot:TRINITY_DN6957_c0_g1_i3.p1 TRINITY_DN6957_c0_g1~~TRINITY_DN6957_c0_g1_i3.p1  ORF type:complete len:397 (-),score=42.75 TRINITY_DN6957_c0_g1_i3:15-1205(-)